MDIGNKIRTLRKKYNLTLEEVGAAVGVGKSTVRKWETGQIANMRRDKIAALAEVLHTTPEYLMDWKEKTNRIIPVYGQIAAGLPLLAVEDIEDYEEIDEATARNGEHIALRIHGDSMEPRICDGDVIIIRKQPTCEDGDVCAVCVNGDYATCKKVRFVADGIMLVSLNTAYEPQFYSKKQCEDLPITIIGRVVELRGKV